MQKNPLYLKAPVFSLKVVPVCLYPWRHNTLSLVCSVPPIFLAYVATSFWSVGSKCSFLFSGLGDKWYIRTHSEDEGCANPNITVWHASLSEDLHTLHNRYEGECHSNTHVSMYMHESWKKCNMPLTLMWKEILVYECYQWDRTWMLCGICAWEIMTY